MAAYNRPADQADFTFAVQSEEPPELRVTDFSCTEQLGDLFALTVHAISDNAKVDKAAQLGQPCCLTIREPSGTRHLSGIVRGFARTGQGTNQTHYAIEVVPVHWYLTRRQQSRILQTHICSDMTVPGVIAHVLKTAGIPDSHVRFALQEDYPVHEAIVQYRETDYDFITRLMQRDGLYFFFEHTADAHVLVIADGAVAHVDAPDHAQVLFREPQGMVPDDACIFAAEQLHAIQVDAVTLDDFDFKNPAQQLRARQHGERFAALEVVDYPGSYTDRTDGEHRARVRLEAQQAQRHEVSLQTTVAALQPGLTFEMQEHPDSDANRKYLIVGVTRSAQQMQSAAEEAVEDLANLHYQAVVRAIPAEVPYRTPLTTPHPQIAGSQTALVVGPPGEEIWPDEYGRIKVQFHWDQAGLYNEESSAWIRVSQGWAGGQYGMFFLPRVGQEVVVSFLEGDPDHPLVTGSVHNKDNMPPVQLPDEKTCSTIRTRSTVGGGGANEIRFEDRKDEELLFLHAQRDYHMRSQRNTVETIAGNRHMVLSGDQVEQIGKGISRQIALDTAQEIGGNNSLQVGGNHAETVQGNHATNVSGAMVLDASGAMVLQSSQGITLKCGGNFITIDPSGIYVMGTVVHVNGTGSPLTGTEVATVETTEPSVAAETQPGTDVTYQPDPETPGQIALAVASNDDSEDDSDEPISWVEIELVDQAGMPVAGEPYEVVSPSGKKYTGSLDTNGQAHIAVDQPGMCQVSFPKRDYRSWARANGAPVQEPSA